MPTVADLLDWVREETSHPGKREANLKLMRAIAVGEGARAGERSRRPGGGVWAVRLRRIPPLRASAGTPPDAPPAAACPHNPRSPPPKKVFAAGVILSRSYGETLFVG
jgi:hypothetical protein